MNGFTNAKIIEARGLTYLLPFIREQAHDGRFVLLNKGPLAKALQESLGDLLFNSTEDRIWSVEIKCETENKTGNLFLEMWSNRNLDNRDSHATFGSNPGWMLKLKSDLLFYYFILSDDLYVTKMFDLQRWAFGHADVQPRIGAYPLKRQEKYSQRNDTWGACVPIADLAGEVGLKHVKPRQLQLDLAP